MIPSKFSAGDSLSWIETVSDYPASAGWVLHIAIFNARGAYRIDSVASGDDHSFGVTSGTTRDWNPGSYDWASYVTRGIDERKSLSSGRVRITGDVSSTVPSDGRSHARRMLDAIESCLEGRANDGELDMLRGAFRDREIEQDTEKLVGLRARYLDEVAAEDDLLARRRGGRGRYGSVRVRFSG